MIETYVIHVTKECNCNCKYCYEKDKESIYCKEEIEDLINNIYNFAGHNKRFNIEFLGGEPMLAFDNIKSAYEWIELTERNTSFNNIVNTIYITTNGTILEDEHIKFLKENKNIVFSISLDGNKIANQLRVFKDTHENTFDKVIENIDKLNRNGINYNMHIVTHPYNIAFLRESIHELHEKGIRCRMNIGIIESTMSVDENYLNRYLSEMHDLAHDIISNKLEGIQISDFLVPPPKNDIRTYVKDSSGKVIGETYGRNSNDYTSSKDLNYKIIKTQHTLEESNIIVYNMRKKVYDYYQQLLQI